MSTLQHQRYVSLKQANETLAFKIVHPRLAIRSAFEYWIWNVEEAC